jgi:hypothetical protein
VTSAAETGGRHQTWRPPVITARLAALLRREYGGVLAVLCRPLRAARLVWTIAEGARFDFAVADA